MRWSGLPSWESTAASATRCWELRGGLCYLWRPPVRRVQRWTRSWWPRTIRWVRASGCSMRRCSSDGGRDASCGGGASTSWRQLRQCREAWPAVESQNLSSRGWQGTGGKATLHGCSFRALCRERRMCQHILGGPGRGAGGSDGRKRRAVCDGKNVEMSGYTLYPSRGGPTRLLSSDSMRGRSSCGSDRASVSASASCTYVPDNWLTLLACLPGVTETVLHSSMHACMEPEAIGGVLCCAVELCVTPAIGQC